MQKTECVKALIAKGKMFTADDEPMLTACTDEQFARFKAAAEVQVAEPVDIDAKIKAAVEAVTPKTEEDVLKILSGDLRETLAEGLRVGKERKAASIKALKDSGRCDLTDAVLATKSQTELDQLVKLANLEAPKVDFSAQGSPRVNSGNTVPAPPDLNEQIRAAAKK